jgi:superfamily II DNA helicase RecQ
MALKFFTIPTRDAAPGEAELNGFLSSQRVLSVERQFVSLGENSFWAICVDYLPASSGAPGPGGGRRGRIDYREVLSPETFAVFARLRDLRKQLAQAEAVPVYTIFTNDQLAEMARRRASSKADLEAIASVGDARVGKYGPQFLAALQAAAAGVPASAAARPSAPQDGQPPAAAGSPTSGRGRQP